MGVRFSWCVNQSCHRLYGDCAIQRPGNVTWSNSTAHPSQHRSPQVGSIWTNDESANITSHAVVNHFIHFIDPVTGVHMNNVESYWNQVKRKLKHTKGCHRHHLPISTNSCGWNNGEEAMHLKIYALTLVHSILYKLIMNHDSTWQSLTAVTKIRTGLGLEMD